MLYSVLAIIVLAAGASALREERVHPILAQHCDADMYHIYQANVAKLRQCASVENTCTQLDIVRGEELEAAISEMKLHIRPVPELNEHILVTYAYCDPEVGYGQGMKVVLATLIRRLGPEADEAEVFRRFVDMMDRKPLLLRDRFKKGAELTINAKLDSTLEKDMPKMYNHVANEIMMGMTPSTYVSEWFRTMFSYDDRVPETLTDAVWDAADTSAAPWDALLQFAVCFFRVRERDILAAALEEVATVIKRKITGEEESAIVACYKDWKNYASSWTTRLIRTFRPNYRRL